MARAFPLLQRRAARHGSTMAKGYLGLVAAEEVARRAAWCVFSLASRGETLTATL